MTANASPISWKLAVPLLLGMPALVLAWLLYPGVRPQDALARRWQAELVVLPADELPLRMSQLAALGDAGLPVLANALHGEREEAADAAYAALEIELVRWHALDRQESSRRAGILARELARHAGQGAQWQQRAAATLATPLLAWKNPVSGEAATQLAADCETVLRAAARPRPREALVTTTQESYSTELAREDLPLEPLPDHELSSPVTPADFRVATSSRRLRTEPSEADSAPPSTATEQRAIGLRSPRPFPPSGARPLAPGLPISTLDDLALMRQLHSADDAAQSAAEGELMRRGYTAFRLHVARRLTDPDPAVRRELAELLPQMSGLDARPWLLWLSEDGDPSVRRAAVAILATSTDPKLRARLRELRTGDNDE